MKAAHPDLMTPEQFSAARAHGSNGWPEIERIGRQYDEIRDGKWWDWLTVTWTEAWAEDLENLDEMMMASLGDTYPLCAEVDAALESECLVPVWDGGIAVLPGAYTLNLLKLRANIQLQRGQFEEARKEVRRIVQIAWRFDAAWSPLGCMMTASYRRLAVQMLLRLTAKDPESASLIDEALALRPAQPPSLLTLSQFDLAHAMSQAQGWLDVSRSDWAAARAGPNFEETELEQRLVFGRESLTERSRVLQQVEQHGWEISKADDARQYLKAVQAEVAAMSPFEWFIVSQDVVSNVAFQLVENSLNMEAFDVLLKMRKLELETQGEVDFRRQAHLPENLEFRDADDSVQIVPAAGHPLLDWDRWSEDDSIAEYPKLKP